MAGNGWNAGNCWKLLEIAGNSWNGSYGWICIEMAENDWKWMGWLGNAGNG